MTETSSPRVLYVEDDASAARLLQKRLNRAGYDVDLAYDGEEGLAKWLSGSYHILAVDHDMPKKKGLDVIRDLASRGPLPPALLITGHGNEMIAVEAMKLGADDYIIKDSEAGYLDLVPHRIEEALARRRRREKQLLMEDELRRREEMFATVFDTAPYILMIVDKEGLVQSVNHAGIAFSGKPAEALLGLRGGELFQCVNAYNDVPCGASDECSSCPVRARVLHTFRTGEAISNGEARLTVLRDSREIDLDLLISTALIKVNREDMALLTVADVTAFKHAESERLLLATAIEQASERVEITNASGDIVYVNPAYERVSGYSRIEILGNKPGMFLSGQHPLSRYGAIWDTISNGHPWTGNLISKKKDGTLFEEEVTISPVKDHSGRIINYVSVKRDVTNQIRVTEQVVETERMHATGTLAGKFAHDFNALLQEINGYAERALLELRPGHPGHSELLEIRRAGKQAAQLIQGLLTFGRRVKSELRPFDLNAELRRFGEIMKRNLPKIIEMHMNLSEELDWVNADPEQLKQVVLNLCLNARDAMPNGGRLTIETTNVYLNEGYCSSHPSTKQGNFVLLSISDTGMGMNALTKQHIFDPFFTTKQAGNAVGLGLSVVFGIVKNHGGRIECSSAPGEGSTFRVHFPAVHVS